MFLALIYLAALIGAIAALNAGVALLALLCVLIAAGAYFWYELHPHVKKAHTGVQALISRDPRTDP